MVIIPAIDLRQGRVVRLLQGEAEKETVYHSDPAAVASDFARQGASRLHVVDLDGAFGGSQKNLESIKRIAKGVDFPLQVGGGVRDLATAETLFSLGVSKVILGTVAVGEPALVKEFLKRFGPARVSVAVDAREGRVAIKGWVESSQRDALEFAMEMEGLGVEEIIYTDIGRDGMLKGPNVEALKRMAGQTTMAVIASGGVSSLEDIRVLSRLAPLGVTGIITGQALYRGKFSVSEAVEALTNPR